MLKDSRRYFCWYSLSILILTLSFTIAQYLIDHVNDLLRGT